MYRFHLPHDLVYENFTIPRKKSRLFKNSRHGWGAPCTTSFESNFAADPAIGVLTLLHRSLKALELQPIQNARKSKGCGQRGCLFCQETIKFDLWAAVLFSCIGHLRHRGMRDRRNRRQGTISIQRQTTENPTCMHAVAGLSRCGRQGLVRSALQQLLKRPQRRDGDIH